MRKTYAWGAFLGVIVLCVVMIQEAKITADLESEKDPGAVVVGAPQVKISSEKPVVEAGPVSTYRAPAEAAKDLGFSDEYARDPERVADFMKRDFEFYRRALDDFYESDLRLDREQVEGLRALNAQYYEGSGDLPLSAGPEVVLARVFGVSSPRYFSEVAKIIGAENFERAQHFKEEFIKKLASGDSDVAPLLSCCMRARNLRF